MSGKIFECGYGAIVEEDVLVLESCLEKVCTPGAVVKVCEIGCHDGGTALGIKRYVEAKGCKLDYYGIDPDVHRIAFAWPDAHLINGDSAEVFHLVPEQLDLLWIDGCHCRNHVILDTVNYVGKVRNFGFVCYHDVNPKIQGVGEKQYHGPERPEFMVNVTEALRLIHFPWAPWEFFMEAYPQDQWGCGTRAYRKGFL